MYADPDNSKFDNDSWNKIMSPTNTDELFSNAPVKTVPLHELGHNILPYTYTWSHDVNIAEMGLNVPWDYLNSVCDCQFNSACRNTQTGAGELLGGDMGTGPNTDKCFFPIVAGHYGPNGMHPFNIMNYKMPFSDKLRSSYNIGSVNCITGPEPAQAGANNFIQPQNLHEILPNGTVPWQGTEEVWLLAYDLKHIEDGATFDQNSTGHQKLLIRTPMSIDAFPGTTQHMYISFYSRSHCGPYGYDDASYKHGMLFVSWGSYRPHTTHGGFYSFNSCPVFVKKRLGTLGKKIQNQILLSSWYTGGSSHPNIEPDYFPGWSIRVIEDIRDPATKLRLAIKLRISAES